VQSAVSDWPLFLELSCFVAPEVASIASMRLYDSALACLRDRLVGIELSPLLLFICHSNPRLASAAAEQAEAAIFC